MNTALLAEVYETAGMEDEAMEVYAYIYTNLKGEGETIKAMLSSAYRSHIRILALKALRRKRQILCSRLMSIRRYAFYKERSQLVPSAPTTNLSGGPYLFNQKLEFYSDGGYDIYYATADEVLPEEGTLYTEPILLTEGYISLEPYAYLRTLLVTKCRLNITLPCQDLRRQNLTVSKANTINPLK